MRLSKYQLESDPDEVDVDLVCSLVKHVHEKNRAKPDGAILVFLPGWDEISKIKDALSDQASLTNVQIMPLHSMVSPQDQRKVFQKKLYCRRTSRKRRSLLTTSYTSSILENSRRKDTTRTRPFQRCTKRGFPKPPRRKEKVAPVESVQEKCIAYFQSRDSKPLRSFSSQKCSAHHWRRFACK